MTPRKIRAIVLSTSLLVAVGGLTPACGGPCNLGDQEDVWKDVASAAEGSQRCIVKSTPYDCRVGDKDCTLRLFALFSGETATDDVYASASEVLVKAGYAAVEGSKKKQDQTTLAFFKRGDKDRVLLSVGKLGSQVELSMITKPSN